MVELLFWMQAKHWLADWVIQPRYMHANKGKFGHPGGIIHAGFHAALTAAILSFYTPMFAAIAGAEFVAHYLIDWAKMASGKRMGLVPVPAGPYRWPQSETFWIFLGFDQWLHQLCYIAIIWFVFR